MDEANYFPKLNRPTLISLAAGWASGFEGVNKISLHHYIGNNAEHRYALLFSLDYPSPSGMPSFDQSPEDWPSAHKTPRHIIWASYIRIPAFRDVYTNGETPAGYEDEWFVHPVFDGEAHPSFASDKSWQLYPNPVKIETHSEKEQPERSKADLSYSGVGTDEISEIRDPDTFIRSLRVSYLDGLELPPQANDPAFRGRMRQFFMKTNGRAPSREELDIFCADCIIETGSERIPFEEIDPPMQLQENTDQVVTPDKQKKNFFHREGTGWYIGFQDEKDVFTDYKYIRYISLLLENPGRAIGALKLVHTVDDCAYSSERKSRKDALDEGLSVGSNFRDDEISNKKVKEFEKLIADIDTETDPLVKKELEAEYRQKAEALKKMNALVDKSKPAKKRRIDDPHRKRAYDAVRRGLDNAYSAFKKRGLKKLARHLSDKIQPAGNYDFCYRDTEAHWDIKL